MPSTQQLEIEFEQLLNRHLLTICKICWAYSEYDKFYFDELRSHCIIELWHEFSRFGLDRFRGESKEDTWVYQIVLHAVAHYFRNPHNLQLPHLEKKGDTPIATEDIDVMSLIGDLMYQLNNTEKHAFMHYLNNHSYATIAQQDNISEAAARKRMSRLLSKIKTLITAKSSTPTPREDGGASPPRQNEKTSNP